MDEYIDKVAFNYAIRDAVKKYPNSFYNGLEVARQIAHDFPAADVRLVPEGGIGEMSDGYHTFNGLYYQRMVLFSALVNAHNDRAWKSWKHEDGEACFGGGWFIVGIDTPQGSYTYHYEDKYWNWFECEELPVARHWDGHTEEDVTRLLSLPNVRPVVKATWKRIDFKPCGHDYECSSCRWKNDMETHYCPNCGARMEEKRWSLNLARSAVEKQTCRDGRCSLLGKTI